MGRVGLIDSVPTTVAVAFAANQKDWRACLAVAAKDDDASQEVEGSAAVAAVVGSSTDLNRWRNLLNTLSCH